MMTILERLAIARNFQKEIPVDLRGLCRALGIDLFYDSLGKNISGHLKRVNKDRYKITINADQSEFRQRFTLAHEIGHFILHNHLLGDGITDSTAYRANSTGTHSNPNITPDEETEANSFAANLLMPKEKMVTFKKQGITDPKELADKFNVSQHAMEIRLSYIFY